LGAGFWQGKTVLVTGHTGFKGTWLSLWLTVLGARVVGYALPPVVGSLYEKCGLAEKIESHEGDITNLSALSRCMQQAHPQLAFHLAAQSLVLQSYQQPVDTFAVNVLGTAHFLEACRTTESLRAAVVVTSDKCYENNLNGENAPDHYFREGDPLGGHDPYSASKACAELVAHAYQVSYFSSQKDDAHLLGVATARAGNVIGGGDWSDNRLIPDIVRSVRNQIPLAIRHPEAIRPWQHVLESLQGYLTLAENLYTSPQQFQGAWNFGPDSRQNASVRRVTQSFLQRLLPDDVQREALIQWGVENALHEAPILSLNSDKAREKLGWIPRLSLETVLDWVAEGYLAELQDDSMQALLLSQIQRYQALKPLGTSPLEARP
jgi:CDP-glucose 4,6-dehydratase